jgi:hypothetical protein
LSQSIASISMAYQVENQADKFFISVKSYLFHITVIEKSNLMNWYYIISILWFSVHSEKIIAEINTKVFEIESEPARRSTF